MKIIIKNPIKNPRVTEKASTMLKQNVYTFDILPSANKTEIKKAVFALYKVKPIKVNILKVADKHLSFKGKLGVKSGGRKALVYLKEGYKISEI